MEQTREQQMEQHWKNSMSARLKEILKVVTPGTEMDWSKYDYRSLLSVSILHLCMEYETLTGKTVLEILKEATVKEDQTEDEGVLKL
jgi:hypothetical protein